MEKLEFYDQDKKIMSMGFHFDEFVWTFYGSEPINVQKDSYLYEPLEYIMNQDYVFYDNDLGCYKDENKLVWYSDCYYNPDDKYSVMDVNRMTIERKDDSFSISCVKPLDEVFSRLNCTYVIAFSPSGNGKLVKNKLTNTNLQDDIVNHIYFGLLEKNKRLIRQK